MREPIPVRALGPILPLLLALACGGEPAAAGAPSASGQPEAPRPRVEILSPADGDTVAGPVVMVRLAAHDFRVVPAGDTTANSGHHHLFLDRDPSPAGAPIPAEPGRVIHLGTGADSLVLEVGPGEHVLIALVGDAGHVPLEPAVSDTVRFVVP